MEITLLRVEWSQGEKYSPPKAGNVYVVVHLRIKNLGPGTKRSVARSDFKVRDPNGAVRGDDYKLAFEDCYLYSADLPAGASMEGCLSFEVPLEGSVEFIYAPYQYEGLKEGRYLGFELR
jgi:hypothetical protein